MANAHQADADASNELMFTSAFYSRERKIRCPKQAAQLKTGRGTSLAESYCGYIGVRKKNLQGIATFHCQILKLQYADGLKHLYSDDFPNPNINRIHIRL